MFGAGVSLGLALLCKPVCLLEGGLGLAVVIVAAKRRSIRLVAVLAAGVVLPFAVWIGYFAAKGGLASLAEAVITYNLHYQAAIRTPLKMRAEVILSAGKGSFLAGFVGMAALAALQWRRRRGADLLALGWCLVAVVQLLAMGWVFTHYLHQLVAPMAVATGLALAVLLAEGRGPRGYLYVSGFVLMLLASVAQASPGYVSWRAAWKGAVEKWQGTAAREIANVSGPDDRILVLGGESLVYFSANRRPASRFIYTYPLRGGGRFAVAARAETLENLRRNPPAVIVVPLQDPLFWYPEGSVGEWNQLFAPVLVEAGITYEQHQRSGYALYVRVR